ncbi:MAG: NAD-binding protein [Acidobacteriota bacterium]|nr:NAD-binding protein [Acidobacteriota bacterium]MDH3786131.1 NAD-binding protein [Acidobacteriota bacterium]
MKAIVVGGGGVARQLLRRLGERWVVTVVDESSSRLVACGKIREVRTIEGDGSSRVVLKRAGLEQADAVVAASTDDDLNLEVCRLAADASIRRVAAIVNEVEHEDRFRDLGVHFVTPEALAARRLELGLETRRLSSTAFADGRAEAIEFRIAADSPVRGRQLKDLRAASWIVGAILRHDQLIIPHGETVMEAGDSVTVVGAGSDFAEIVRTFSAGRSRFPLDFGKRIAVAVDREDDLNGAFAEAVQFVRSTRASSLLMVHQDAMAVREEQRAAEIRRIVDRAPRVAEGVELRTRVVHGVASSSLASIPGGESVGVLVIPDATQSITGRMLQVRHALQLIRRTGKPVLISRGTQPYRKLLVPARRTEAGRAAMRVAIDIARFSKAELHGLVAVDPVFIAGPAAPREARAAVGWMEEEAGVHGIGAQHTIRRGNPVKLLAAAADESDLVVLGIRSRRRLFVLPVGIGGWVAGRTRTSALLVPA